MHIQLFPLRVLGGDLRGFVLEFGKMIGKHIQDYLRFKMFFRSGKNEKSDA